MIHAAGIFRPCAVMVDGRPTVVFGEEFFDFPIVGLSADAELEIFSRNGIPVLF